MIDVDRSSCLSNLTNFVALKDNMLQPVGAELQTSAEMRG